MAEHPPAHQYMIPRLEVTLDGQLLELIPADFSSTAWVLAKAMAGRQQQIALTIGHDLCRPPSTRAVVGLLHQLAARNFYNKHAKEATAPFKPFPDVCLVA